MKDIPSVMGGISTKEITSERIIMNKKRWTEETASAMIKRNGGTVSVKRTKRFGQKEVVIKRVFHKSPGIKVWGAIDYLKNYCGYF